MEEKLNKKQIVSLVVGVLALVVLIFGATYAYFQVNVTNTSGQTTITGDIGGATLGTVTLTGGDTELYLGINPYDMSENKKGTTYYSSTTEGSRETSKGSAGKTTYTATLSGDTTNTVMYACDYEFTVSASGTMLGKTSTENVEVVFEGDINKTLPLSSSNTVSGTWYGFKESNKERGFNAYLQLTNTDSPQNDLAGTNISIELENTKFECYLSKYDELVGDAYALLVEHPASGYSQLVFVRSETPIKAGELYEGNTILKAATGFENQEFTSADDVPWKGYTLVDVIFADEIRPISLAYWYAGMRLEYLYELDFTNLNTSAVTNMSHMFENSTIYNINFNANDLSNVVDMSYMFYETVYDTEINLNGLDVSNVMNMSHMFTRTRVGMEGYMSIYGIDQWDTSNVTDMSYMFGGTTFHTDMDLSGWDVSSVTNMEGMFRSKDEYDIDLSGWDVSNVTNMASMFSYCHISILGLSAWDVSSVTDMSYMFNEVSLEEINLSSWVTSNVTDMSYMFQYASINSNTGVQNWDVSNVTNMEGMFSMCSSEEFIDLSGWDVSNVSNWSSFYPDYDGEGTITIPPKFQTS